MFSNLSRSFLKSTQRFVSSRNIFLSSLKSSVSGISENTSTLDGESESKKTIEDYYLDSRVQGILKKITGLDLDKIFREVPQKLSIARYLFATDKKVQELTEAAKQRAYTKLEMPPVMSVRKPIDEVISYDPQLQSYFDTKLCFIDISDSVCERDRFIVVRETDGTLRQADWDERFRMNQIYFPRAGRKLLIPEYFNSPFLENVLEEGSYLFLLDSACAQFDPDDPSYHKVTHATYEHVNTSKKFDELRSTRHFGPFAFYLAWNRKIELLLIDMIERELIEDAAELVKLFYILHSESTDLDAESSHLDVVKKFVDNSASTYKPDLELAIQTFCEGLVQKQLENTSS